MIHAATEEQILHILFRHALDVVPDLDPADLTGGRTLSELGLNSLDRTEVLVLTMEELGIAIPVQELRRGDTLAAIAAVLRRHT